MIFTKYKTYLYRKHLFVLVEYDLKTRQLVFESMYTKSRISGSESYFKSLEIQEVDLENEYYVHILSNNCFKTNLKKNDILPFKISYLYNREINVEGFIIKLDGVNCELVKRTEAIVTKEILSFDLATYYQLNSNPLFYIYCSKKNENTYLFQSFDYSNGIFPKTSSIELNLNEANSAIKDYTNLHSCINGWKTGDTIMKTKDSTEFKIGQAVEIDEITGPFTFKTKDYNGHIDYWAKVDENSDNYNLCKEIPMTIDECYPIGVPFEQKEIPQQKKGVQLLPTIEVKKRLIFKK